MIRIKQEYNDVVSSVNEEAKKRARAGAPEGTVIVAGFQRRGQTHSGQLWYTTVGEGVNASVILRPDCDESELYLIGMSAAMATQRAIAGLYRLEKNISWPDDIYGDGKKLGEIQIDYEKDAAGQVEYAVISIYINVHMKEFPSEITDSATSIDLLLDAAVEELGEKYDEIMTSDTLTFGRSVRGVEFPRRGSCRALAERILQEFTYMYEIYKLSGSLTLFLDEYNKCLLQRNKEVEYDTEDGKVKGYARGIDERGNLLVEIGDGVDIKSVEVPESRWMK